MNSVSQNKRRVRIAIDLTAIEHNLHQARLLSPSQKYFAVVKADAYGHGAVPVAKSLVNTDAFAVVTLNEAMELREAGIQKPILLLQGAQSSSEMDAMIQQSIWPVVHCEEQLQWLKQSSDKSSVRVWLKVDSGMGRLGFFPERATEILSEHTDCDWMGLMTHFANADDPNNPDTINQIDRFNAITSPMPILKSMANSAAVLAWPQAQSDWARPGIMLYGGNPLLERNEAALNLKSAMRVSAPIISCKDYPSGSSIGYGSTYQCSEAMKIAYVGIGYGDGLPRVLNGSACVWLAGKQCPIVGRVSMDSIAIDVRSVPQVQIGDEVVLWGEEQPVELLARAANTISYELLTNIRGKKDYSQAAN